MPLLSIEHLQQALGLKSFSPENAQEQMLPQQARSLFPPRTDSPPRPAGVLVLMFPQESDWQIVLTRRSEKLRGHGGQISFPGGRQDPHDRTLTDTALRETSEELGIRTQNIQIIGTLSQIYIPPSHYDVLPTVGILQSIPIFKPSPDEVAEVFTLPLEDLLNPRIKQTESWRFEGIRMDVPFYLVKGHKVWGATAMMLSELEQRIMTASPDTELL